MLSLLQGRCIIVVIIGRTKILRGEIVIISFTVLGVWSVRIDRRSIIDDVII